jgi:hypothetical protein
MNVAPSSSNQTPEHLVDRIADPVGMPISEDRRVIWKHATSLPNASPRPS